MQIEASIFGFGHVLAFIEHKRMYIASKVKVWISPFVDD